MDASSFVDYYKIMGVQPGIGADDLGRRFHRLAKRFHPDNPSTGDRDRFDLLLEAHSLLKDPERRAQYDVLHKQLAGTKRYIPEPEEPGDTVGKDVEIQAKLLAIFYTRRRRNIREPGVPEMELERIFDCPIETLEFHLWYLREKRWIERMENGMLAITVDGIDHVNAEHHRRATTMLLMDRSRNDGEDDGLDEGKS